MNPDYMVSDSVKLSRTNIASVRAGNRALIEREFPGIIKLLPADF